MLVVEKGMKKEEGSERGCPRPRVLWDPRRVTLCHCVQRARADGRQNKHQRATPYGKRKCAPRFGGPPIRSGPGWPFASLLSLAENPAVAPIALWTALKTLPTLKC